MASALSEDIAAPVLAIGPSLAIAVSPTAGVPLFSRCLPAHSVIVGRSRLEVAGSLGTFTSVAVPAGTPHLLRELGGPFAFVAYLDARRYDFADVQRLAATWQGFEPGRDDVREAIGDALGAPGRRVDRRVLRALEALELGEDSVLEVARRSGLSDSRLTHLMTEKLGSPPRAWRTWFRLRRAIGEVMFGETTLTTAAHRAGFADSAHLTRTCKQVLGVRPAQMLPQTVHLMGDAR